MAALALKGMEKATTNFPKDRYLHEPFMQERAPPYQANLYMCRTTKMLGAIAPHPSSVCDAMMTPRGCLKSSSVPPCMCLERLHLFAQANKHLDWESFVLNLRKWAQVCACCTDAGRCC
jgi:hypothetical protein